MVRKGRDAHYIGLLLALVVVFVGSATTAQAITSQSQNYQMVESEFSAGSTLNSCSEKYCAQASIGSMTAGRSSSPAGTASFGSVPTSDDPLIEMIIEPGESYLGVLSVSEAAYKTMSVRVRTYLTDGYILQIVGDAPKYREHVLQTLSTPSPSTPGTEQFGINLTTNTIPEVGDDPEQVPSSSTSFGEVMNDYKIANRFKYTSGDVVARSERETGETSYTVSMVVNVSSATPAGHFSGDVAAVLTPLF